MPDNEDVREWILAAIANPAIAAVMLGLGFSGIIAEFLLPARVIPGALGGVLAVLGIWTLVPEHTNIVLAVLTPFVVITVFLLWVAARARRNKFKLN